MVKSRITKALTLEVSGRCHSERQITARHRSGPLDRIVRLHSLAPILRVRSETLRVALLHTLSP